MSVIASVLGQARLLVDWIARIVQWLLQREARPFLLAAALFLATLAILFLLAWPLEIRIRYAGLFLELAGLYIIADGIRGTRRLFRKPSLRETFRKWLQTRPLFNPPQYAISGTATMTSMNASMAGQSSIGASLSTSLEDRVAALEKRMLDTGQLLQATRVDLEGKIGEQQAALTSERRERMEHDHRNLQLIDEAVAGGLTLESVGLVWLVLGLVFSTASQEIASLLAGI